MRIIETKAYQFDELSDEAKARAIQKHRDWNVDGIDWWEFTYDDHKEKLKEFGYEVDEIYFSGFWSQGDGACFNGHVTKDHDQCVGLLPCDLATRVRDFNAKCRLLGHDELEICVGAAIKTSHQRSHSGGMSLTADLELNHGDYYIEQDHPLSDELIPLLSAIDSAAEDLFDAIRDEAREYADDIYRDLRQEYEWLTSDEQVAESLVANEVEFDEDGDAI